MKILSLYWGLAATASLFVDNQIVGAVSEERFTRIKNDDAFPEKSIRYLLKEHGVKTSELDGVAIASYIQGLPYTILRKAHWTIEDYVREQKERWYPLFYEGVEKSPLEVFSEKIDREMYPQWYWKDINAQCETFNKDREHILAEFLSVPGEKVRRIEHHRCHVSYAYYASPFRGEKVLALTIDGWGDDKNATINIVNEDGSVERVFETTECAIGRIYRYITLVLGMKPNEHEFKVMGLAPYGKEKIAARAHEVFKSTLYVDDLEFKWKEKPTDSYYWFKERLEGCRFDGIAAALQAWTESLLVEWIGNAVREFGISTVVLSGGVAMNVKANGKIAEIPEIKKLFIAGTGSDESMALSSGICLAEDLTAESGGNWQATEIPWLENLYLGPNASDADEAAAVAPLRAKKFDIIEGVDTEQVAAVLADGRVLARSAGRMEFGQRSLGNRSIIADPKDVSVVQKVNHMIKNRDFWMPFAPVVLDIFADKYLVNPKSLPSPHMTLAFDTTDLGFESMQAGCHPADRSARAQILREVANPELYAIILAFSKLTGRGALMNTSFNLHGYPIVNTPAEAVDVLERTHLDGIILNNYLVLRN